MGFAEARMTDHEGQRSRAWLDEHGAILGRVAMALAGEPARAERALERVAGDVAREPAAMADRPRPWLLGRLRMACALQETVRPVTDAPARTARLGAAAAAGARALLGPLPPTEREAVVLHVVGGLELADVAYACNVDVATARERLASGFSRLLEGGIP